MTNALDAAVALYRGAPGSVRWHVRIRRALSRLELVEEHVPRAGEILELGCGHGLFSRYLVLASPGRRVLGIDIDPRKVDAARSLARTDGPGDRLRFEAGDAQDPPAGPFDAVVIVDVFYLLSERDQAAALAAARRVLKAGGRIVWKSQDRRPFWKYALTWSQEWLATRSGLTAGASLCFLDRGRALELLAQAGFRNARAVDVPRLVYTDVIYLAEA